MRAFSTAACSPFLPERALSLETAFAAYTSGSTWVNHHEGETRVVSTWVEGHPVLGA